MEIIFKDPPINLPGIRRRLAALGYPQAQVSVVYSADYGGVTEGIRIANLPAGRHDAICAAVDGAREEYKKKISRESQPKHSKRAKK